MSVKDADPKLTCGEIVFGWPGFSGHAGFDFKASAQVRLTPVW